MYFRIVNALGLLQRKCQECHPDLHPNDKEAEARFRELNEANEVLSDPDKRARYDQFGFNDPMIL